MSYAQGWAVRCMHEAHYHDQSCFITLTFDSQNLPSPPSLSSQEVSKFIRALRQKYKPKKIRFYAGGEYGKKEKTFRPHYHIILFGHDFSDKIEKEITDQGHQLYTSEELSALWGKGRADLGTVTYASAGYVARYTTKKAYGPQAEEHYEHISEDGEIFNLKPEFTQMSNNPGIGQKWLEQFYKDIFPCDFIVIKDGGNYRQCKVPRYYTKWLKEHHRALYETVMEQRLERFFETEEDNTLERLQTKYLIGKRRLKQLERPLQ